MDHDNKHSNMDQLKRIPFWTRKYAQNRGMTLFVLAVIIMLVGMGISGPLGLGMAAFKKGNMILALVCLAVQLAVWIILLIFILKFGGKNRGRLDQLIDHWIYGHEGAVSLPISQSSKKNKWLELVAAIVWSSLLIGTMYLGMEHVINIKYIQPVSALYCVPYMFFSWYLWQSPKMGPIYLLSPMLYAIHALLIIAGAPLFLTGNFDAALNIFLPLAGYGLLAFIISHIYSRYALKKLKHITKIQETPAHGA